MIPPMRGSAGEEINACMAESSTLVDGGPYKREPPHNNF